MCESRPRSVIALFALISLLFGGLQTAVADAGSPTGESTAWEDYDDGMARFSRGDYKGAAIQLKNALQSDARHLPSRILLGRSYLELGEPRFAVKELLVAKGMGADRSLIDIPLAEAYLELGEFNELLSTIDPGRHRPPDAARLQVLRGKAHLPLGQKAQAAEAFAEASRLDPDGDAPLVGKALFRLQEGDQERAHELVQQAIQRNPDNQEAWFLSGRIAQQQGRPEEAVADLSRALEIDTDYDEARLIRAALYIDLDRPDAAGSDLDLLLSRRIVEPMAHYLKALLVFRTGERERAGEWLERAAYTIYSAPPEVLEQMPRMQLLAGKIAFAQGNSEQAALHLQRYLEKRPDDVQARKIMTYILLLQDRPKRAETIIRPLYTRLPNDPQVRLLMGQVYLALKDYRAASELLKQEGDERSQDSVLQLDLARNLVADGQIDEALVNLQQLGEERTDARILSGILYLNEGRVDEALAAAESAVDREPGNLVAINLLGLARLAKADTSGAREAFGQALEINPGFLPAQLNLARVELHEGFPQKAQQRYLRLLDENPGQQEILLALAQLEESRDDREQAIRWREKLRSHQPEAVEPNLKLADLYLRVGRPEQALEVIDTLESRHPRDYRLRMARGISLMAAGRQGDAIKVFNGLSNLVAVDASRLQRIAGYQKQLGDLESAHASLNQAVEAAPDSLSARFALAELEIALGKRDTALGRAQKLKKEFPNRNLGYFLEGEVYLSEQDYKSAERAYQRAQEIRPESVTVLRLYQVRKADRRSDAALRGLEAWNREHPDDLNVRAALARELHSSGRFEEARAAYESLVSQGTRDPVIYNNLATLYQMADDPRALQTAQQAYELAPESPAVADTLGWIMVRGGQTREGLRHLQTARARAAHVPDIGYHLAYALHALGRDEQARRELETLLKAGQEFRDRPAAEELLRRLSKADQPAG